LLSDGSLLGASEQDINLACVRAAGDFLIVNVEFSS
jgi:hypothetical protein